MIDLDQKGHVQNFVRLGRELSEINHSDCYEGRTSNSKPTDRIQIPQNISLNQSQSINFIKKPTNRLFQNAIYTVIYRNRAQKRIEKLKAYLGKR